MTPAQIRDRGAWPLGFLPLPHANHPEGGMTFPQFHVDEIKKQEQRDLQRFDPVRPSRGVACLDCHSNGHTNASFHLVGDIRPQEFRRRIDTPSLRGVNIQRLVGSQRLLKSVEDFTEFEQRAAYFDGDPVIATKKGVNALERGSQVHDMAEFQELLDFPPAPKLGLDGKLDPRLASEAEMRGQKESPPYLNDGRLLTLDDTVEFFNLVLETHLTAQEKKDLVAFLKAL